MPEEHMREGHGLSSAAARLPQPCWEVHHSSEHPTVRLCCSILNSLQALWGFIRTWKFYFQNNAFLRIFHTLSPFHTWGCHSWFNIIFYKFYPNSRPSKSLPEFHEAQGILILGESTKTRCSERTGTVLLLCLCSRKAQHLLQSADTIRVLQQTKRREKKDRRLGSYLL